MSAIVVCGGSVIGLASAMILARDGYNVTVLERDAGAVPGSADEAWELWERRGVPQFRQPHNLLPRYRTILQDELPEVLDGLLAAGGTWVNFLEMLPPFLTDRDPRPDDDKFRFVTRRRPMVEYVHARAAQNEPRVTVRRGTKVEGLKTEAGTKGVPHVTGVRTSDGDLRADLVVDAMGRRSPSVDWLVSAGARPPTMHSQECAFTYYTRHFTGPQAASGARASRGPHRDVHDPDVARRQLNVVRDAVGTGERPATQGVSSPAEVLEGRAGVPLARALARRRADH